MLFAYEGMVRRWRKDLIYGQDGWIFIRFITQTYTSVHPTDEQWLELELRKLAAIAKREGKLLGARAIPQQGFHLSGQPPPPCRIRQPSIPTETAGIVQARVAARLAAEGLALVVDHTETLRAIRRRDGLPYSPTGETHASPDAMFETNRNLVAAIARALGRDVELPVDFPKRYRADINPRCDWLRCFHVVPAI